MVTTDDDPHGNNTEGNGLTGTSGGEYFVDEPEYVHYTAQLPAGATDVRFRYSTDAAYLDTGWFVDDVMVDGAPPRCRRSTGDWFETTGSRTTTGRCRWSRPATSRPGSTSPFEIVDGAGQLRLPARGGRRSRRAASTPSARTATNRDFAMLVSNLPTGDLTVLDAGYVLSVTNTGNGKR